MKKNELFEKFVAFLFDNRITLRQFPEGGDLSPGKRKHLIKKFLDSKITAECWYCDGGQCTEIAYNTFNEPRRVRMQKRCIICGGTGKKSTSIRSIIELRQNIQ